MMTAHTARARVVTLHVGTLDTLDAALAIAVDVTSRTTRYTRKTCTYPANQPQPKTIKNRANHKKTGFLPLSSSWPALCSAPAPTPETALCGGGLWGRSTNIRSRSHGVRLTPSSVGTAMGTGQAC
eukprot:5523971-Prymnesium_polylepis.1